MVIGCIKELLSSWWEETEITFYLVEPQNYAKLAQSSDLLYQPEEYTEHVPSHKKTNYLCISRLYLISQTCMINIFDAVVLLRFGDIVDYFSIPRFWKQDYNNHKCIQQAMFSHSLNMIQ